MRDGTARVQRILLLGGTSDIGKAIVTALVRRGGVEEVLLAARDPDRARRRHADLENDVRLVPLPFDATDDPARHDAWVERVWAEHGDVDVVVVAFGILGDQARAEQDTAAAVQIARVNYVGAVSVLSPLARRMASQGHGSLVVLSSVAGDRARAGNYVYGSAKAGLDAFAQGLRQRLAQDGVHVLVVRPGFVHTRMTEGLEPAPLAVDPEQVARDTLRGLDRGAGTVYAPPSLRAVMSALRHLPRPLFDRIAARERQNGPD